MTQRPEARHRRHQADDRRDIRLVVRYNSGELARVKTAAEQDRMAVSAWIAEKSMAAADPAHPVPDRARQNALDAIVQAAEAMRQASRATNTAIAGPGPSAVPAEELAELRELARQSAAALDGLTLELRRQQ